RAAADGYGSRPGADRDGLPHLAGRRVEAEHPIIGLACDPDRARADRQRSRAGADRRGAQDRSGTRSDARNARAERIRDPHQMGADGDRAGPAADPDRLDDTIRLGVGYAAFAPDGKRILFGFWCLYGDSCPASSRSLRNATLATIHPDGHGLRLLRLNTGADGGTWSPDGKRIAFRCRSGTGLTLSFRLCTSKLNGTSFRRFPWPVGS